ncbi:hypothetical protein ACFPIJ_11685 [Dactylosporangium cerinum]|uniref:Uncharacterized protein n=1 Tax=Dactylosporangium cerinum TaxID=1434730 RepID=A0ABV9VSD7_9ACTN
MSEAGHLWSCLVGLIGFELDGNIVVDQFNGVVPEQRWGHLLSGGGEFR